MKASPRSAERRSSIRFRRAIVLRVRPHPRQPRSGGTEAVRVAVQLALAGDKEAAMGWLIKAREHRDLSFPLAGVDPKLAALHADPRFIQMVRGIGLEVVK